MSALTHVSASQIKDFKACNRLWYYTRILKQRAPQTEAQSRGTTVHGALEAHLKAGAIEPEIIERAKGLGITEKDLSDYIEAMKPFVGAPGEGLTEFRDSMPTFEGGPEYVLVVDHAREIVVDGHGVIPQIDDLKTTSDFRYCKTPDELSKDVQMVSYAKWALLRLFFEKHKPPPSFVSLRHVYVRTRGKRVATARDVLVTPADVEARWNEILEDVRDMVALAAMGAELNPQDVPATTTDHCSAYGGCFFRAQCFGAVYDTSRPLVGLFNKEKKEIVAMADNVTPINGAPAGARLSLKDRVAQRKSAGSTAAPAATVTSIAPAVAPAAPAPAAASTVTCGVVNALMPGCPCTLVPHSGDHESKGPTGGAVHWSPDGATAGLGPSKDWAPLAATAAAPAVAASAPTAASVVASFTPDATVAAVLPPDAAPRTSTPEEVAAEGASKRKRATKAEMAARAAAGTVAAASAPVAEVAATPAAAPTATSVTTVATATTIAAAPAVAAVCPLKEMYVDCFPVKPAGVFYGLGEDILQGLSADAAKAANVPDWRLVEFGKGKGAMAVLLRERLASMPEILVVSSSTPGSDVLIEVLSPHARRVVRALRG